MRDAPFDVELGCYQVDEFLGYFFIGKCMWSTPATIRQYGASLKKLYACMLENGHIKEEVVSMLTLVLFYLTSWNEKSILGDGTIRKAWKSADWGALDYLRECGLVDCSNKAKSVTITPDGEQTARYFLRVLGFDYLVEE